MADSYVKFGLQSVAHISPFFLVFAIFTFGGTKCLLECSELQKEPLEKWWTRSDSRTVDKPSV